MVFPKELFSLLSLKKRNIFSSQFGPSPKSQTFLKVEIKQLAGAVNVALINRKPHFWETLTNAIFISFASSDECAT